MPFGYQRAKATPGLTRIFDTRTQEGALYKMAEYVVRDSLTNEIFELARAATIDCPSRDDWCELDAIYNSIKFGNESLADWGLGRGIRYVADDRSIDQFVSPARLLRMARKGAGAEDCDGHAMLSAATAKSIGFKVGLRAYGGLDVDGYDHVYGVALISKRGPWKTDSSGRPLEAHVVGLDTTHPPAKVGWQPPEGRVMTLWID